MKSAGFTFGGLSFFLLISSVAYWYTSKDPAGATALGVSCGFAFIISYYLLYTSRRVVAGPEDRGDADISEGAGEVGFFSPASYWPFVTAAGFTLLGLGIVYGLWIFLIGGGILGVGALGLLFEYYVGA